MGRDKRKKLLKNNAEQENEQEQKGAQQMDHLSAHQI
jgi:hypothetical protein